MLFIAAIAIALYLSICWNSTPLPIVVMTILSRVPGLKSLRDFGQLATREDFEQLSYVRWPWPHMWRGHWLNCAYCNAWFFALIGTAVTTWDTEQLVNAFPKWAISVCLIALLERFTTKLSSLHYSPGPVMQQIQTAAALPQRIPAAKPFGSIGPVPSNQTPQQQAAQMSAIQRIQAYHDYMGYVPVERDGKFVMTYRSTADQHMANRVNQFFSQSAPCFFPGCDEMRAEYAAALAAPPKEGACKTCNPSGDLMRMYAMRVKKILVAQDAARSAETTKVNQQPDAEPVSAAAIPTVP